MSFSSSSTYTFPNTLVQASFLPAAPGTSFSPIFYGNGQPGNCMGSVNAGNSYLLYVDGSGINAAFRHNLIRAHQDTDTYTGIHQSLYSHAATGTAHRDIFAPNDPLQYAAVWRPLNNTTFFGMDGTVFIDVFKPGLCPYSNPNNYAMIYITPPDGNRPEYATDAMFLDAVEQMAVNLIMAVASFNKTTLTNHNLSDIEVIRTCMYSSNIYMKAGVTIGEVAKRVYAGFASQLAKDATGIHLVEFENADGGFDVIKPFF
ncbi:MAG TPA: hypothetical protein DCS93_36360 [Microscillaceae bacterium]|nr:hypothetical protein [Microscillaceae bacterium]